MAGLKGLEGMFTKAASSTGLQQVSHDSTAVWSPFILSHQYNIWETHCMTKIVPALLLNMQMTEAEKYCIVHCTVQYLLCCIFVILNCIDPDVPT